VLFNSLSFIIFFPTVTLLYFLLPHKLRWAHLLAASCVFYMVFKPIYILILLFTILIDYFAGILIAKETGLRRKQYLVLSLIANIGVLAIFKYYNFLNLSIQDAFNMAGVAVTMPPLLKILLPVGLSFHTFQSLSYTIEVYRGHQEPERNLGIFALYVMFYPQLVAGPIERPQNLLWQFRERHYFESKRVFSGLQLMLWGLFKKVVIADRLAPIVNAVYNDPHQYTGVPLIVATVFFAFQIYCDFSGYSDVAIGSSEVMGFTLMRNFERPYFSKSIAEFWKRWHISLSTWFRDYVYIQLGGNRVSKLKWYRNLFLTFTLSGLWHGANWTYVIWGALNGFYLIAEIVLGGLLPKSDGPASFLPKLLRTLRTFALTCLAWIFFRANSLGDAIYIISHLVPDFTNLKQVFANKASFVSFVYRDLCCGRGPREFLYCLVGLLFLFITHWYQRGTSGRLCLENRSKTFRVSFYYLVATAVIFYGAHNDSVQFIYFQF
jgi:alginate O-acetyltransferase complex protein AlgI